MWLSRTRMLFGEAAISRLAASRIAVFGIGGVGGHLVEALARSGVGELHLFDNDTVCETNLNRQIIALHSNIGQHKVDVAAQRIHDINPTCKVVPHRLFYLPENADSIDLGIFDFVADCVDTVSAKAELIRRCTAQGIPLITCMGAANKFDPTAFRVGDLSKTQVDPLAKALRKKLRTEGIRHSLCVWSEETPASPKALSKPDANERPIPASNAFVPAVEGLIAASEIIRRLTSPLT